MPDVNAGIGATIGSVIATNQADLVEVVHTLKQVVCLKG
jgi:RNA-splicing ligase RtcB